MKCLVFAFTFLRTLFNKALSVVGLGDFLSFGFKHPMKCLFICYNAVSFYSKYATLKSTWCTSRLYPASSDEHERMVHFLATSIQLPLWNMTNVYAAFCLHSVATCVTFVLKCTHNSPIWLIYMPINGHKPIPHCTPGAYKSSALVLKSYNFFSIHMIHPQFFLSTIFREQWSRDWNILHCHVL